MSTNLYEITFDVPDIRSLDDPRVELIEDEFDGFVVVSGHGARVTLVVDSVSGATAGREAAHALRRLGVAATRTVPDLVRPSEIAERAGVTRQAVGAWARGERGENFPAPFVSNERGLWLWGEVNDWLAANGHNHDSDVAYPTRQDHTIIDYHMVTLPTAPAGWVQTAAATTRLRPMPVDVVRPVLVRR